MLTASSSGGIAAFWRLEFVVVTIAPPEVASLADRGALFAAIVARLDAGARPPNLGRPAY